MLGLPACSYQVFVPYCDGSSYTSNRTAPLLVATRTLWFRGRRILDAILSDLDQQHQLRKVPARTPSR